MKPRKSFGHEGAEGFHGRMSGGGAGSTGADRFEVREDRRTRDRDQDGSDRRNRNYENRSRDQDGDEVDGARRNGPGRSRTEGSWRDSANRNNSSSTNNAPMSNRERIEKAKSWRDRDPDDRPHDRYGDRSERNYERRWDRDRQNRVENEPEWLDEPAEGKPSHAPTEEDFKKFMEAMKAKAGGPTRSEEKPNVTSDKPAADTAAEPEQKVAAAPPVDTGPDKFFATYGNVTLDVVAGGAGESKDSAKPKTAKSSRFMAFLAPQEDRTKPELPTPAAGGEKSSQQSDAEREAFAALIQKLQRSGLSSGIQPSSSVQQSAPPQTQPSINNYPEPPPFSEMQRGIVASPDSYPQYANNERRDDPRVRTSQHSIHDIISPRPMGPTVHPPPPVTRPEQALQELLAQRHQLPAQTNIRAAQNATAVNSNTEYLMRLMQSHRDTPEPPRTEQPFVRMPQPTKQVSLANLPDRDPDFQREHTASQRQPLPRQGGPPGFLDESQFRQNDVDGRSGPQPTQILQRPPPPPGLDQMHMFHHMGGVNPGVGPAPQGGSMPGPQRPMIPPPGLMNNGPRNVPMPGMYPPNFPPPHHGPGNFPPGPPPPPHAGGPPPPPEGLVGPGPPPPGPPRSMQPPPGFFGGPPPPGFMPPPNMGAGAGGFQGPPGPGPDGHPPPPPPNAGGPPGPGGLPGFGGMPGPYDRMGAAAAVAAAAAMDRRGMLPPPGAMGGYRP